MSDENIDAHTLGDSHRDENSAPHQVDNRRPKPIVEERPMTTPDVSKRTPQAQYPGGTFIPEVGHQSTVAAGYPAVWQSMKWVGKESPIRSTVALAIVNKKGGFDCPSCAYPDPDHTRHAAEFCESGAKAVAWEATSRRVPPEFFAQYSVADLANQTEKWLGDQGRITHPMVLRRGSSHYQPIEWADAFRMIADELNGLAHPDEAMFYTSGRASNEAAFVYQLFIRQFGTNNLPDCSNMCHESTGVGLTASIGVGKATIKIGDFEQSDSIFIIGHNPGTNHPRMLTDLEKAVRNGCKIVAINPLPETGLMKFRHPQDLRDMIGPGTDLACLHLPVKVNGDIACLKGIMKEMLAMDDAGGGNVFDYAFIRDKTQGFDAVIQDLRDTPWEKILDASGLTREQIREAAEIAAKSKRMITVWAMGITQHISGVANVQTIVNFNFLRGQVGRVGAGLCPMRGHSNVQGDRTVGIWEQMSPQFLEALGKEFNFAPPATHGLDAVRGLQAMHEGRVKVFFALGGNFLSAMADTEYGAEAFRRTKLSVQVSTKLNRNHLITGEQALILPCLGRTERDLQKSGEQFVSCENTTCVVQMSKGVLAPASPHLMSETAIVCELAKATLGSRSTVDWTALRDNYDRIRDHIEHVVPGFTDYNKRVRQKGGFYLPHPVRDKQQFPTDTQRGKFVVHPIPTIELAPDELLMTSLRSHDQFNTTIYGEDDRYRGIYGGRRVIFMNEADIAARGLNQGDWVDINGTYEGQVREIKQFKVIAYSIPKGCCATYYPENNPLVPLRHVAAGSNQPASKSIPVRLTPAATVPEKSFELASGE
ncbi:MAG TPA: FdhF/YdeP family oxidoreductase [Tepidisphaeraceae bacterium]|jgi:molybdopterin-dependent oxidoreductase alpha subunit